MSTLCMCKHDGTVHKQIRIPQSWQMTGKGGEEGIGVGVAREALGAGGVGVVRVAWGAVGVGWADGTGGVGVVREA